jgi:hypothetical protein
MERAILQPERAAVVLGAISHTLAKADKIVNGWPQEGHSPPDEESLVAYYVEGAYIEALVLLESAGLSKSFEVLESLNSEARKGYAKIYEYEGDLYLVWSEKLRHFLSAIQHVFGELSETGLTKGVEAILQDCEYVITDHKMFPNPPSGESDVHLRIEGILRAFFRDVRTKPPIAKPIKNFYPDTGLPSVKTLIEYKYVENKDDVARVSDEILADTRGYVSKEWNQFIYVIYETARLKSERYWRQHLLECGITGNTRVIVLRGESPARRKSA